MKNLIKKTLEILTKKDKINFIFATFFLIIKSILDVLGIGLIIPILNFTTSQNNNFIYDYFPSLEKVSNHKLIILFVFIFVFVYLIKNLFIIFYNSWSARFVNNLSLSLTMRVLKKYLNENYIFFLENNPSFLIRNICSETGLFAIGLIGNLILSLTQIVFIFSICLFLIIYNIYSLYVILFLLFVCVIIIKITNAKFKKWGDVRQEKSALILKRINEIVGSIKEVILYNKRNFFAEEFYSHNKKLANANIYRDTSLSFTGPIIEFMGVLVFFSFFLLLVVNSSYGLGEITVLFGVFAFASIKLLPASISLSRSLQAMKFNMPACDVVYEILVDSYVPNEFYEVVKNKKTPLNSIKFENVSFTYKNQKNPTLNHVNFEINQGDKIAIIGETGSGKTTLLNILATLVNPSSGRIKINNSDQLEPNKEIRNNIGYVPQSVYLSDNSILSNISLSNEVTPEEERFVSEILQPLNLNTINNKPIDIFTPIGERGSKLSGGQIQRIGIARALFRDPGILILDEATNALDNKTENQILDYLFKKMEKKIIVLCTHKKDLLKYCNKVFEIKNNKINISTNKNYV